MVNIVIAGAGWAGCASAVAGIKAGAKVTLIEKADMILGTGLVGGIMRNNGRFTAAEELICAGGGELINLTDKLSLHQNVNFPHHNHASLYDVTRIEPAVRSLLKKMGVDLLLKKRIVDSVVVNNRITKVILEGKEEIAGDVFIDATGSAGPMAKCRKYGQGCSMCILRCPSFGSRVSLAESAGIKEEEGQNFEETAGSISGSCKMLKNSIDKNIILELERKGIYTIPINKKILSQEIMKVKACQQYVGSYFKNNLVLLDTGLVKLMVPYFPVEVIRRIPGLEKAIFNDPYAGGLGNSIRLLSIAPRDNTMKVEGLDNLFCAGEKSGLLVGHTEAMVTGTLAGHNAVRSGKGRKLLELPLSTAGGMLISYAREKIKTPGGKKLRFTFSGSVFFKDMIDKKMYLTDRKEIAKKIDDAGLTGIFQRKIT